MCLLRTSLYPNSWPFFSETAALPCGDPAARWGPWYFLSRKKMWPNEEDESRTKKIYTDILALPRIAVRSWFYKACYFLWPSFSLFVK